MANKKQPTIEDKVNAGYIDLTKTGPISYRELQRLNGSLPQESEANSLLPDDIGVTSTLSRAGKVNYTETWSADIGFTREVDGIQRFVGKSI